MPKHNKELKTANKPYSRSKQQDRKFKSQISNDNIKKKSITKSERVKNADITNQLDDLMDDISNHLTRSKKSTNKNKNKVCRKKGGKEKNKFIIYLLNSLHYCRLWNNKNWTNNNDSMSKCKMIWMTLWDF